MKDKLINIRISEPGRQALKDKAGNETTVSKMLLKPYEKLIKDAENK